MPVKKKPSPIVLGSKKMNLKEAEVLQLETFLKSRSKEVDDEIESLKNRLKIHNLELPLEINSFSENMNRLETIDNIKPNLLHDIDIKNLKDNIKKEREDKEALNQSTKQQQKFDKLDNDLKRLLNRIQDSVKEQQISPLELINQLLPPQLMLPDQTALPLAEVVDILMIDLAMPIDAYDQDLLLDHYRVQPGVLDIDVKRMLKDAGLWIERQIYDNHHHHHSATSKLSPRKANEYADLEIANLMLSPKAPTPNDNISSSKNHRDIPMDLSLELSPSPVGVKFTEGFKSDPRASSSSSNDQQSSQARDRDHSLPRDTRSSSLRYESNPTLASSTESIGIDSGGGDLYSNLRKSLEDEKRNQLERTRVEVLQAENYRLKRELGTFDSEFFDQLEDLKFRYSTLQDIVGEGGDNRGIVPLDHVRKSSDYRPNDLSGMSRGGTLQNLNYIKSSSSSSPAYASGGGGGSSGSSYPVISEFIYPPIDKLGWGTRNSLNALDRVGITQPIRGERSQHPDTFTYAPSGVNNTNMSSSLLKESGHSSLGGIGAFNTTTTTTGSSAASAASYSPTRRMVGGVHGLGGGTHTPLGGDGYSNLCERRLVFELTNHLNPSQATRALIHRVTEVGTGRGNGYISVLQLFEVFQSIDLKLSPQEVEALALGFASDGSGGINVREFCEAVQSLMYNVLGNHQTEFLSTAEEQYNTLASSKGLLTSEPDGLDSSRNPIKQLLVEIVESILVHDRKAVLGSSDNIGNLNGNRRKNRLEHLVRPFLEIDHTNTGIMTSSNFVRAIKALGVMLTLFEIQSIAKVYACGKSSAVNFDFKLSSDDIGFNPPNQIVVSYKPFLKDITLLLERNSKHENNSIDKERSSQQEKSSSWILKEFDLVDAIIEQIENMKPADRRRSLMSLQYALQAVDTAKSEEVDGFTLLKALIGAGIKIQRLDRVRLLRAAEELGGKMKYSEFFEVLLKSCSEWPADEQVLVGKILYAMGVTVLDRRAWLARVRQALIYADAHGSSKSKQYDKDPAISPASFLHILRENGLSLSIEEEATLLDCLDTERQAEIVGKSYSKKMKSLSSSSSSSSSSFDIGDAWTVPKIHYKSFLSFCGRHCGHWSDASPELNTKLKKAITSIQDKQLACHELNALLLSFDEEQTGHIGKRAFQIACHRSRLLANMHEDDVDKLATILSTEGAGKINYSPFMVHIKVLCSKLNSNIEEEYPDITMQLIKNATDHNNTLIPLRAWLVNNTDVDSFSLTPRDMNALLREFSVVYRPEDVEALMTDLIYGENISGSPNPSGLTSTKRIVDTRELIKHLLSVRGSWTNYQHELCLKIRKLLKLSTTKGIGREEKEEDEEEENETYHGKNKNKISNHEETLQARKIITRLRALSSVSHRIALQTTSRLEKDTMPDGFIEKKAFSFIVRGANLALTENDINLLADATDYSPFCENVRFNVIIESLATDAKRQTEENKFALIQFTKLLWNTAVRLNRSRREWQADVWSVFKGFDPTNSGFISTEDFELVLSLLTVPLSHNLLKELPMMPVDDGLLPYKPLLEIVLNPPDDTRQQKGLSSGYENISGGGTDHTNKTHLTGEHSYNYLDAKYEFKKSHEAIEKQSVDNYHRRLTGKTTASKSPRDLEELYVKTMDGHGLRDDEYDEDQHPIRGHAAMALNERNQRNNKQQHLNKDFGYTSQRLLDNKHNNNEFHDIHKNQKKNKNEAVHALVKVVRKCMKDILMEPGGVDLAHNHMLKAFRRFDMTKSEKVTPRDFCLAVSVLIGDDAIVLNKQDWNDIITHFLDDKEKFVEYEEFCRMVLKSDNNKNQHQQPTSHSHSPRGTNQTTYRPGSASQQQQQQQQQQEYRKGMISNTNTNANMIPAMKVGYKNPGRPSSRQQSENDYNLNKAYGLTVNKMKI